MCPSSQLPQSPSLLEQDALGKKAGPSAMWGRPAFPNRRCYRGWGKWPWGSSLLVQSWYLLAGDPWRVFQCREISTAWLTWCKLALAHWSLALVSSPVTARATEIWFHLPGTPWEKGFSPPPQGFSRAWGMATPGSRRTISWWQPKSHRHLRPDFPKVPSTCYQQEPRSLSTSATLAQAAFPMKRRHPAARTSFSSAAK